MELDEIKRKMNIENELTLLKKRGWFLSASKIKGLLENNEFSRGILKSKAVNNNIEKWALDRDIKEIGEPCLPEDINSGRISKIEGPMILQVKKIVNIAAPQIAQDSSGSSRMLKISLTDGKTTCHSIEYRCAPRLNLKIPPGTKVCLKGTVDVNHGFVLLTANNIEILGGEVEHLLDKWTIQQSLVGHSRSGTVGGPPPWVPFGQRLNFKLENQGPKKGTTPEPETKTEENEGFNIHRHEAIVAAEHAGSRQKTFGGAGKQAEIPKPEFVRRETRGGGRGRNRREDREEMQEMGRPREAMNLFEFLQPQIATEDSELTPEVRNRPVDTGPRYQRGRNDLRSGDQRGQRGYRGQRGRDLQPATTSRAVEQLAEDFAAWPSLNEEEPAPLSSNPEPRGNQNRWSVNDYCLAKWQYSENYYPAIIQGIFSDGTADVLFVENGLVRNVELRNIRLDAAETQAPKDYSSNENSSHRNYSDYSSNHNSNYRSHSEYPDNRGGGRGGGGRGGRGGGGSGRGRGEERCGGRGGRGRGEGGGGRGSGGTRVFTRSR